MTRTERKADKLAQDAAHHMCIVMDGIGLTSINMVIATAMLAQASRLRCGETGPVFYITPEMVVECFEILTGR